MSENAKRKHAIVENVLNASKKAKLKESDEALTVFHEIIQELKEARRQNERIKEDNRKLMEDFKNMKMQRDEYRNRLSSIAGQKMREGNADVADLSDPFRPTNLAEKFHKVYDDKWTPAYEILQNNALFEERKIVSFLADIVKSVDDMCTKTSESQITKLGHYITDDLVSPKLQTDEGTFVASSNSLMKMEDTQKDRVYKLLKEFRKSFATYAARPLIEIFEQCYMKKIKENWKITTDYTDIKTFVSNCVEIIWLMKIQSPPMELLWQKDGDICDKDRFTFYTKKGARVAQCVWPAVLLHSGNGPLVSKGVIQGN